MIVLLDPSKKYSLFKCVVSTRRRFLIDKKLRITRSLERRLIKTSSSCRNDQMMGVPLIADDLIGFIIVRDKKRGVFDITDQKILMILAEQSVMGVRN